MLKWKDFIQTGFRHVKHIKLYQFFLFTKFLYCWNYSRVWPWCKFTGNHRKLQTSIRKHPDRMERMRKGVSQHCFSCRLLCESICIKFFSSFTVRFFFNKLLVQKFVQYPRPVLNNFWIEKFNIDDSDVFFKWRTT